MHVITFNGFSISGFVFSCCTDILLEDGEIKADEIWDIYTKARRIPQVASELGCPGMINTFYSQCFLGFI